MRALLVNAVCGIKSTGRICTDIAKDLESQGYEVKIAYGRDDVPEKYKQYAIKIGNKIDVYWHALMARLFDQRGSWSRFATKKFLKWADEYNPDFLWLHNIHDYYINISMLFEWIKSRPNMQVKWTQHDCWSFTGRCMYFTMIGCDKWQIDCNKCPNKCEFPNDTLFRKPCKNFLQKKEMFLGVKNLSLVVPSKWLGELIKQSFLKEYPVEVIYNEIDKNIFKPTPSDFKEKYHIDDKKMVLGVASPWSKRKGLDDFFELSHRLDDRFVIVLVGLSDKQIKKAPKNIIAIARTNNAKELAEIYTAADFFINPTYEDNYPTVNLESQACGSQCITYRTGGSPESVPKENVISVGDLDGIIKRIEELVG